MKFKRLDSVFTRIIVAEILCVILLIVVYQPIEARRKQRHWQRFGQEVGWDTAKAYARLLEPLFKEGFDQDAFAKNFEYLRDLNQSNDLAILDSEGRVLSYLPNPESVSHRISNLKRVDLAPIREFLSHEHYPGHPIFMPNYFAVGSEREFTVAYHYGMASWRTFSVAPLPIGNDLGYVLIGLGKSVRRMEGSAPVDDWYIPYSVLGVTIISSFGLLMYLLVTRRISKILAVVREVSEGNYSNRIKAVGTDEIAELSKKINSMVGTIADNIEDLEQADQVRREMVASISHDLNSPLTSIQGYLNRLVDHEESTPSESRKRFMRIALTQTKHVGKLVDQLLEISKIDANKIELALEDFSLLDSVTEDLLPRLMPLADRHGVSLDVEHPDSLLVVWADPVQIERVMANLIENGIRYSDPGGEVRIILEQIDAIVKVSIIDNGRGIPAEQLPLIFERFYRVDKARTRGEAGTGLGLSIAQEIIQRHNQEITVSSELGVGTTFSFELPMYVDEA